MHQLGVFPLGGEESFSGPLGNICNSGIPYGATLKSYLPLLTQRALPFLEEFTPELLIVSAGYDALASDELASVNLLPKDYFEIAKSIKESFGAVAMGLEGGYSIEDLPHAIEATLRPYIES